MPAFFLKANEDKAFWSNVIKAIEYTVDIITTFSGIGNIAKFRYLANIASRARTLNFVSKTGVAIANAKKIVAVTAGVVEITSGVANTLLKITGLEDTKGGNALAQFLFYLELLSLSGELTVGLHNALKKSAKEVLEHEDVLRKTAKNSDEVKLIDEAVEELEKIAELDYLAKWDNLPISGKGYLGGKTLRRKEIKFWIDEIDRISKGKSKLIVLKKGDPILSGHKAGFNPYNGNIYVEKGLTEYEIFHEFKHLEEFTLIGKDKYIEGMKRFGGNPTDDVIRTYKREMYVYNEIMKESKRFNKEQLKHAYKANIAPVLEKLEGAGIDINKIKITK